MHPVLFRIGGFTVYTYGFFAALAMMAGLWFILYQTRKWELPTDQISDLFFYSIIAGLVGARLFYVLLSLPTFIADPLEIFRIWNGGLVFYGGFLTGLVFVAVYIRYKKLPAGKIMDMIGMGMPLAHGVARIGCFFAGCCYGKPSGLPWAVSFCHHETLAQPVCVPLHPTQLYCSLGNFLIFLILLRLSRTGRFSGRLIFIYLMIYGLFRTFVEIFRGDERGAPVVDFLSTSQTIGLTMAAFAAVCLTIIAIRNKRDNG
ncbi:MAG: prolipoprotein diacylglyceryl transferase [Thermodesulfobacteriota bacterium]